MNNIIKKVGELTHIFVSGALDIEEVFYSTNTPRNGVVVVRI